MRMKNPKFSLLAECNIAVDEILWRRGLGLDYRAQKYLASEIVRLCDKYTPMRDGTLKNSARVSRDGSTITYPGPYAHYQYMGIVYGGTGPKHPTDRQLTYNGGPMRGAYWDRRMMADRSDELVKNVDIYIKRRARGW